MMIVRMKKKFTFFHQSCHLSLVVVVIVVIVIVIIVENAIDLSGHDRYILPNGSHRTDHVE
jgi:hypothetical protein